MLEYFKILFPDLLKRIKKSSVLFRIFLFLLVITVPVLITFIWKNQDEVNQLLSKSITFSGYSVLSFLLLFILALIVINILTKRSKRKSLKLFVISWSKFIKNFEMLFMYVDVWLIRDKNKIDENDEIWQKITEHLEIFWPTRDALRKLIFQIGEKNLMVYENQHWNQLKNEDDLFKERNYEGPFSLLLDLSAPIGEINHYKKAINWSLKISEEYIEHLCFKHPFLEKHFKK